MNIATAQTRRNRVAQAIADKRHALGFHMIFACPEIIDILGREGFDFVYLDAEHGSFDLHDIDQACRAAELCGITVLVRIPRNDPVLISHYLDHGVQGIIVPHVSCAKDAQAAVDACYYFPRGKRSYASARINGYRADLADFESHFAVENSNVTLTVQIEDTDAIDNLDEILEVKGIDYITIGKHDLALSMGVLRSGSGTPHVVADVVKKIEGAVAKRHLLTKDDVMIVSRVRDFLVLGARTATKGAM